MAQDVKYSRNTFIGNVIWYVVGIFDYLNTSSIYMGYVTPALMHIFQQTLQYIFFPFYAFNSVVYTLLALNAVLFDRHRATNKIKSENVVRLIVNMFSTAIVVTAVVGALAFAATMGIVATFLFAINLLLTGIYNTVCATYHLYQYVKKGRALNDASLSHEEHEQILLARKAHAENAVGFLVVTGTIAMVALAGALVMIGGFLPLAGIGIAAGIFGAAFCAYAFYNKIKEGRMHQHVDFTEESRPVDDDNTTLFIGKKLSSGRSQEDTDDLIPVEIHRAEIREEIDPDYRDVQEETECLLQEHAAVIRQSI